MFYLCSRRAENHFVPFLSFFMPSELPVQKCRSPIAWPISYGESSKRQLPRVSSTQISSLHGATLLGKLGLLEAGGWTPATSGGRAELLADSQIHPSIISLPCRLAVFPLFFSFVSSLLIFCFFSISLTAEVDLTPALAIAELDKLDASRTN